MSDFDVANVEYERERMPEKKSGRGCLSVLAAVMVGVILWNLILEIFHIIKILV